MAGYDAWTTWTSASSSDSITVWGSWSSATTTNSTSETEGVWWVWCENGSATVKVVSGQRWEPAPETEEQKAAREQRAAEARERAERERQEREAAARRARELLLAHLSEEQRASYEKDRCFEVRTGDGKRVRRYKIRHGWAGNVEQVNEQGRRVAGFCIHPCELVPVEDNLLAQKLMLEADEERFLAVANRS